jgi:translation elongation factor EF-Tu-like GTPase
MSIPTKTTDFIAILKYRTTDDGGRETPAFSSYRPQIKFAFSDMQTSGQQTFIDKEVVFPGEEVEAEIAILAVEFFQKQLTEGMDFEFREGPRIIGTGKIKKIINERLRASR